MNKRGQVTVFIIIAILIVAIGLTFYFFRDNLFGNGLPSEIEPIYSNFLNCLEGDILTGANVLESQGGYITLPNFELGSLEYPSSSQLNFVGNPIPYWYYVSRGGVQKEQIPTLNNMEKDLEDFVVDQIDTCTFQSYYSQGYEIDIQNPEATINIRETQVDLDLKANMVISRGEDRFVISNHKISVKSNLGQLYSSAKSVYEKEQNDLFLEEYAIDFLRNYAPVDGVDLSCAPKIWEANTIFDDLQDAIEVNTLALKSGTNTKEYFVTDFGVDEEVKFVNSRNWPSSFEVLPADTNVLVASPVGNQPGLGILGFCYVPYHFVYNINYPVLVQVINGDETFQFPMVVVIAGNQPREPLETDAFDLALPELCQYKNTPSRVLTYDSNSRPINANISFECFGTVCDIGETSNGVLDENFPQCVNGQIYVSSEGYKDEKILYSSVEEGSISVVLDREYEKDIRLLVNGQAYNGNAFITFSNEDDSKSIVYPSQKQVSLSKGSYEIQVQIYRNSSLRLGATTTQTCAEVPRGLLGFIGITKKECFDVEVPETIITTSLSGGGTSEYQFDEGSLRSSSFIDLNVESLPVPTSLDELQVNYILFDEREVEVALR